MSAQSQNFDQVTAKDTSRQMHVKPLTDELNQVCDVEIQEFLLHGELMCNPDLLKLKENKFNAFGAMIKPQESESAKEICEKMQAKGYATLIREDNEIILMMNKAFNDLLEKHGIRTVHYHGKNGNFHNMLHKNKFQNMGQNLKKGAMAGILSATIMASPAFADTATIDPAVAAFEQQIPILRNKPPVKEMTTKFYNLNEQQQRTVMKDLN